MPASVVKLKIDSNEFDAKLKTASQNLNDYLDKVKKGGGDFKYLDEGVMECVKAIGKMETNCTSAKGGLTELTKAFTDMSLRYKQFTDAEKATPLGKEMEKSLQELKIRIQDTKKDLADISKELNGTSGKSGGINSILAVFGGNVLTKATGMLSSELTNIIKKSTELATQADGIQIAFRKIGSGEILDGLRRATHNTVSDLELMKAAVKFNDFKLPLDQLGTMLAFAQQKAKDTGQSVDYMVDSIVTGLGRKSVQILDNLGISASEIRNRMKETGDMTKAVGDIIREQMQKAGDYIETASDRAAKANVELENQMLKLGETMRDVFGFDGWEQMATSIKATLASVLTDIIGKLGTIKGLLGGLTVGQAKTNRYGTSGVPAEVERDLQALQNASGTERDAMYKQMLAKYEKRYNEAAASLGKAQGGYDFNENSSNWKGVPFVRKALDRHYWSTQVNTARSNAQAEAEVLAAFRNGANGIFNPAVTTPAVVFPKGGGGSGGGVNMKELNPLQQAQKEISELTEEALTADDARLEVIKKELAALQQEVAYYKEIEQIVTGNLPKLNQSVGVVPEEIARMEVMPKKPTLPTLDDYRIQAMTELDAANTNTDTNTLQTILKDALQQGIDTTSLNLESISEQIGQGINVPDEAWQGILDKYNELREQIGEEPIQIDFNTGKISDDGKKAEKAWQAASSAVQSVGSAFAQIKNPAARVAGIIAEAIANVALSFSKALSSESKSIWTWIAAAASGTATMFATISAIQSATSGKYAEGGIIPGNSYSGDNLMASVNAGELILNRAAQGNLASQLQGAGQQQGGSTPFVSGEQIYLGLSNYLRRSGRGELLTARG